MAKLEEKLKKIAKDLTTLDVVTMTGKIDISQQAANAGPIDLKKLIEDIFSKGSNVLDVDVNIVAITHQDFDCDTVLFIKDGLSDEHKQLITHHNDTLKASQQARKDMLKLASDLLGKSIEVG